MFGQRYSVHIFTLWPSRGGPATARWQAQSCDGVVGVHWLDGACFGSPRDVRRGRSHPDLLTFLHEDDIIGASLG